MVKRAAKEHVVRAQERGLLMEKKLKLAFFAFLCLLVVAVLIWNALAETPSDPGIVEPETDVGLGDGGFDATDEGGEETIAVEFGEGEGLAPDSEIAIDISDFLPVSYAEAHGVGVQPPAPDQTSYTVVSGDSWWRIAEKTYGKGYKWKIIKEANPGIALHPGGAIVIPPLQEPVSPAAPFEADPAEGAAEGSYIVVEGDSFWKISKKVYGDGKYYGKLATINGMELSAMLRPGLKLHTPPVSDLD